MARVLSNRIVAGIFEFFFSTTLRKYEFANTGGKFLFAINGGGNLWQYLFVIS